MMTKYKARIGVIVATAMLAACAAKPSKVEQISSQADASAEMEATQKMLNEAKAQNLDILAPKNFARAQASLDDAQKQHMKGTKKEKVLENIAEARGWLAEAQTRGDITGAAAKDLSDARSGAIRAGAPNLYAKEFKNVDDEMRDVTTDAEKGNLSKLTKEAETLTRRYRELETQTVTKNLLGEAQLNLEAAKKEGAAKTSPKTLQVTEEKINSAINMIKENPRNTAAIERAAIEATDQSKFLITVNQKTKAGNTEDLVLQTEKQQRTISGLKEEYASTESELKQKASELEQTGAQFRQQQAALKTAEELRSQLKPNEAEVFVENNAVKVRLKGVQFGSNQATINKKSAALLEKVDQVIGTVGVSSILVEGYTDSVGSDEANKTISQKRALAVQNYMVNKGKVSSNQIKAVGMGEENPISDNTTPRGRAENRRIDLLIEPKVE